MLSKAIICSLLLCLLSGSTLAVPVAGLVPSASIIAPEPSFADNPAWPEAGEFSWEWPVPGFQYLSASFADPYYLTHTGIDIVGRSAGLILGAPIYAVDSGEVIFAGWSPSSGYCAIVETDTEISGHRVITRYMHMSALALTSRDFGTRIDTWRILGYVGSTGNSSGPHLHLDVNARDIHGALPQRHAIDPMLFFAHLYVPMQP